MVVTKEHKRYLMSWSKDMDFKVILTNKAETQAQKILDYIFYELKNTQADRKSVV